MIPDHVQQTIDALHARASQASDAATYLRVVYSQPGAPAALAAPAPAVAGAARRGRPPGSRSKPIKAVVPTSKRIPSATFLRHATELPATFRLADMVRASGASVAASASALHKLKSRGKLYLIGTGQWSVQPPAAPKPVKPAKVAPAPAKTPQARLLEEIHAKTDKSPEE